VSEELERKIEIHDKELSEHSKEIADLKTSRAVTDVKMDNLCEKLGAQTKSINWLIGLMASGLLGFFFYAVQTNLFK